MKSKMIISILTVSAVLAGVLSGCGKQSGTVAETAAPNTTEAAPVTNLKKTDMSKWHYSEDKDLYY